MNLDSACGSVGRGLRFESSHQQNIIPTERRAGGRKDENKEKEAGRGSSEKN